MKRHITVTVTSFGYEHNHPPQDAQFLLDVRQLLNPKRKDDIAHLTGLDKKVQHYVLVQELGHEIVEHTVAFLEVTIPSFRQGDHRDDITYLVAVGCKRGKRRSVAMAEAIAERLRGRLSSRHFTVRTEHRDIDKDE